jgi:rubrerythrin
VLTRRTALLGGTAALLLAGCGSRPVRTLAGDPSDVRVLRAALEIERTQIAVYEAGLALTRGRLAAGLHTILAAERAHASAIEELLRELGATPAPPRAARAYSRGVPRTADAWFRHAIRSEDQWSAGYGALVPKLRNQRLRATFGSLSTTEAEHSVALGLLP